MFACLLGAAGVVCGCAGFVVARGRPPGRLVLAVALGAATIALVLLAVAPANGIVVRFYTGTDPAADCPLFEPGARAVFC